jgi:hypothetical protein
MINHFRPVYKPHSVQWVAPSVQSSIWAMCHHIARCSRPEAMRRRAASDRQRRFAPAWPCSRRGLPGHLHYCKCRWSLTPPFHHHCIIPKNEAAVCFCGPFPASLRLSAVPRPGCSPTPCSMECGLSSILIMQNRDCPTSLK